MAPDDRGMRSNGGRSGGGSRLALKKGPWTTTEDGILMEYVEKNGEGNWNAVQRNSGLLRCGKSCRLRWANHLRPHLKKGAFSLEEEDKVVNLHWKNGNKWARMAAQLPGRTDNEIKNFWNTRLKRRQRAGLPIYPPELLAQTQQENNQPQSLISSPFDHQRQINNNPAHHALLNVLNPSTMKPPFAHHLPLNGNNIFRDPSKGLSLTLPSSMRNSPFLSASASMPSNNFGHALSNLVPVPSFQQNYPNFSLTTRPFMGIPSNQNELISGMDINSINYPSGQSLMTASSSENTCSDFGSSDANNYADVVGLSRGNSGLLEDLLEESETINRSTKIGENNRLDLNEKGKSLWEDLVGKEAGDQDEAILTEESVYSFAHGGDITLNNNSESSSSDPNASSGIFLRKEGSLQGINQVDEELMCFFDLSPLDHDEPVPNWYDESDEKKNNSKIGADGHKAESQVEDSSESQVAITTTSGPKKHDWELGGCCWNNMPSFC